MTLEELTDLYWDKEDTATVVFEMELIEAVIDGDNVSNSADNLVFAAEDIDGEVYYLSDLYFDDLVCILRHEVRNRTYEHPMDDYGLPMETIAVTSVEDVTPELLALIRLYGDDWKTIREIWVDSKTPRQRKMEKWTKMALL